MAHTVTLFWAYLEALDLHPSGVVHELLHIHRPVLGTPAREIVGRHPAQVRQPLVPQFAAVAVENTDNEHQGREDDKPMHVCG